MPYLNNTVLKHLALLMGAFLAARVLFIVLMPATYSIDLHSWLRVMDILRAGGNPYRETDVLNWPPFWMQILFGIHHVCKRTGIDPIRGIQTTLIICEAIVMCITYFVSQKFFPQKSVFKALLFGLAINPVSILLSCQHCNYDVFVGLWILLATYMLMEFFTSKEQAAWLAACFFIGMGILAKTVPIILTPLLLTGIRLIPWRIRLFGLILLLAPITIGMSVLISLEPHGVMQNVIGYRSLAGWYGITGLMWGAEAYDAIGIYKNLSPYLFLSVIGFAAWKCCRIVSMSPAGILMSVLLIVLFIPTFGPGYSPPYILWYLPLAVLLYILSGKAIRRFLTIGWIITILTYSVEYAFFNSHGSFLSQWYPTKEMHTLSERLGSRWMQTLIRLPMFLFYVAIFIMLIWSLRKRSPEVTS